MPTTERKPQMSDVVAALMAGQYSQADVDQLRRALNEAAAPAAVPGGENFTSVEQRRFERLAPDVTKFVADQAGVLLRDNRASAVDEVAHHAARWQVARAKGWARVSLESWVDRAMRGAR